MAKHRTIASFMRGSMKSNDRRKFIYYACSDDAIGRSNIEVLIRELGLSDKYINPSRLERPEYDDKSAACKSLRRDIRRPDAFFIEWLSPSKCEDITDKIVVELINKARSSSVLWLLICIDTGSPSSAVRKTILFKSDTVDELLKSGIPNLMKYIDTAENMSAESSGSTCKALISVLKRLRQVLTEYKVRLLRESNSLTGMGRTYQLVRILLAAMALWILSYGKPLCSDTVCGRSTRTGSIPSRRSDPQHTSLDPRIEYILQYFKAMHIVRSDIDSIASSTNIDRHYLRNLTNRGTDIPYVLVANLVIPDEGNVSLSCTNKGPCSSSGYYRCSSCTGETDNVLTMDTIEHVDGVCLGCECRDQGALLKAAENYLGLVRRAGRIILTGVHREHSPFTYSQLANPSLSGGCTEPH